MKNLFKLSVIFIIYFLLETSYSLAQNLPEIYLLNQRNTMNTARSMALGGAVGCLGDDLSSFMINPSAAAISFSNMSSVSGIGQLQSYKNSYDQYKSSISQTGIGIPAIGGVYSKKKYDTNGKEKTQGLTQYHLFIGYNRNINFNQEVHYEGNQIRNTICDVFAKQADGIDENTLISEKNPYGMAFNTNIIYHPNNAPSNIYTPIYSNNNIYTNPGFYQSGKYISTGKLNEFNIGFAANLSKKICLGASFQYIVGKRDLQISHQEIDTQALAINFVQLKFDQELQYAYSSVGIKLGSVFLVNQNIRFGLAYHVPYQTWVRKNALYILKTTVEQPIGIIDFELRNEMNREIYAIRNPGKLIISGVFSEDQIGKLSMDLEIINFQKGEFYSLTQNYNNINSLVSGIYKTTTNFKIGTEIRLNKISTIAIGYQNTGNPFQMNYVGSQTKNLRQTIGMGYNFQIKKNQVGFSISESWWNSKQFIYGLKGVDYYGPSVKSSVFIGLITYSHKF